jgi:cytochrome c biogenesis protein CcdA
VQADLGRVLGAVLGLIGLGFTMGFSPTLYDVTLHVLGNDRRPQRLIAWMTVGLAVGSTLLLLIFRVVNPTSIIAYLRGDVEAFLVQRIVDLTAGVLFVLAAVVVDRVRRLRPYRMRKVHPHDSGPRSMFLIGLANAVIGVSGIATMYVTGRVIAAASSATAVDVLYYLVFLVPLVGPYLVVGWVWERYPALSRGIARVHAWVVRRDFRPLLALALLVAGLVFIVLGIWGHSI